MWVSVSPDKADLESNTSDHEKQTQMLYLEMRHSFTMRAGDIFISEKKSSKTAESCKLTLISFATIMREILAPESHFPFWHLVCF